MSASFHEPSTGSRRCEAADRTPSRRDGRTTNCSRKSPAAAWTSFIGLWDTDGLRLRRTLLGHKGEVWSLVVLPDNRALVSGAKDGSVLVWDMTTSRRASSHLRLPENLLAWSFATNGQTLLTLEGQGSMFNVTAFSPDGAVLGSMNSGDSKHGILHLWRAPSWAEIEAAEKKSQRDDRK